MQIVIQMMFNIVFSQENKVLSGFSINKAPEYEKFDLGAIETRSKKAENVSGIRLYTTESVKKQTNDCNIGKVRQNDTVKIIYTDNLFLDTQKTMDDSTDSSNILSDESSVTKLPLRSVNENITAEPIKISVATPNQDTNTHESVVEVERDYVKDEVPEYTRSASNESTTEYAKPRGDDLSNEIDGRTKSGTPNAGHLREADCSRILNSPRILAQANTNNPNLHENSKSVEERDTIGHKLHRTNQSGYSHHVNPRIQAQKDAENSRSNYLRLYGTDHPYIKTATPRKSKESYTDSTGSDEDCDGSDGEMSMQLDMQRKDGDSDSGLSDISGSDSCVQAEGEMDDVSNDQSDMKSDGEVISNLNFAKNAKGQKRQNGNIDTADYMPDGNEMPQATSFTSMDCIDSYTMFTSGLGLVFDQNAEPADRIEYVCNLHKLCYMIQEIKHMDSKDKKKACAKIRNLQCIKADITCETCDETLYNNFFAGLIFMQPIIGKMLALCSERAFD